ncbi:MFS transporter [Rhodophyticola sp. SM2404]
MLYVIRSSWPLLLGMLLLMVGNGLQGTLLGVRGDIEGFSTFWMSVIMSAYFLGFLGGSQMAPDLIRRVGHIRTFAALGSVISAVLILYPAIADPVVWTLLRVVIGFCFSAVYVTAESWLNNSASNETRGQALSLYMIVQMSGLVAAQGLLVLGDPSGYILFVVLSVLVSLSFAPILLSVTPTPAFETTEPMSFLEVFHLSPLGCIGIFVMGAVYAALFGMSAVYGTQSDLSLAEISLFVGAIYVGGLLLQFPIGWISDRMDRRVLIAGVAAIGTVAAISAIYSSSFYLLLIAAFAVGAMANPLYALLLAHTNDFLEPDQMAAAGGRLLFINGVGAVTGPLIVGALMGWFGPQGFFLYLAVLMAGLATYAGFRMTRRPSTATEDTISYAPVLASASAVAVEVAQEVFAEATQDELDEASLPPTA